MIHEQRTREIAAQQPGTTAYDAGGGTPIRLGRRRVGSSRWGNQANRGAMHALGLPTLLLLALIGLWEALVRLLHVDPFVLPTPTAVVSGTWADRANVWLAAVTTSEETALGLLIAIVLGVAAAVAVDWSVIVRRGVYPLLVASQTLPLVTIAPLIVIWFGFGLAPGRPGRSVQLFRGNGRHGSGPCLERSGCNESAPHDAGESAATSPLRPTPERSASVFHGSEGLGHVRIRHRHLRRIRRGTAGTWHLHVGREERAAYRPGVRGGARHGPAHTSALRRRRPSQRLVIRWKRPMQTTTRW